MTDKTQPTAHAEITAPISADLRRIEGESPVSQAVRLLREAAAELKNGHTIGGDWGDEIEALDAYNERMAVAATLEQAEAGQAVPAHTDAPINEPVTKQMIDAGAKAAREYMARTGGNNLTVIYRAMRAVAPAGGVSASPAQEHATQLAGQGQELADAIRFRNYMIASLDGNEAFMNAIFGSQRCIKTLDDMRAVFDDAARAAQGGAA